MSKFIAVLDFALCEVHIFGTEQDPTTEEAEEIIQENGHAVDHCEFMIMDVLALNVH